MVAEATLSVPGAMSKLDSESFSHKVRSVKGRDNILSVHGILVLDETEAVHQLDLGDFSGSMCRKVSLNIGLGSCSAACQWHG